ncbi:MAG: Peptidoglycan-binding LysM [Proteobacteria bacterium]|nr:Peptidoglycan-binding LysM [Pseudomonadota bacterium]
MLDAASRPQQISPPLSILGLLTACFVALPAGAAGLGEITLHSRIGESLLAEIPLTGAAVELTDPSCYALAPHPGSDLPVITNARLKLIRSDNHYRLLIIGSKALVEPVFTISLRVNCGVGLQHDYILMPDAPAPLAEISETTLRVPPHRRASASSVPRPARQGRPARQAGPRPRPADGQAASAAHRENSPAKKSAANAQAPAGDRLILSAAPLALAPGETPVAASDNEIEERLLTMETSLRALNQEIETLNSTLKLSTEMAATRHQLQLAESLQQPAQPPARPPLPEAGRRSTAAGSWLQLGLGALLGGALASTLASWLGRHQKAARRQT